MARDAAAHISEAELTLAICCRAFADVTLCRVCRTAASCARGAQRFKETPTIPAAALFHAVAHGARRAICLPMLAFRPYASAMFDIH